MSKTVRTDNPAGRLYAFLQRARAANGDIISRGLAKAFGIEENNFGFLYGKLHVVYQLVDETSESLKILHEEDYLGHYEPTSTRLKELLTIPNFNAPWLAFKNEKIKDADLTSLAFVSSTFSKHMAERVVEEVRLKELHEKVKKLYDEPLDPDADLDIELRRVIASALRRILDAIDDYALTGIGELDRCLKETISEVVLNPELAKSKKRIVIQYADVVLTLSFLVQIATFVRPALPPSVQQFLPTGP
jgi:hypothetical protein